MLLTDKYADKIHGIITCYDRMIIQGYIPNWSHAEAMTAYMKLNGIRIFDYPTSFSQPLTEQVRQNAEKIAHENGMEIEFIRKLHAFRSGAHEKTTCPCYAIRAKIALIYRACSA